MTDTKSVAQGVIPVLQTIFHQGSLVIIYSIFLFKTDNVIFFCIRNFYTPIFSYAFFKEPIKNSLINVNNKTAQLLSNLNETFSFITKKVFNMKNFQFNKLNLLQSEERKFGFKAALEGTSNPIGTTLPHKFSNNINCYINSITTKQYIITRWNYVCDNWQINNYSNYTFINNIYLVSCLRRHISKLIL